MSPVFDEIGATLVWLFGFAPLILLGLIMAMDPSSFRSLLQDFADVLRRFERQIQTRWRQPFFAPDPVAPSPKADTVVRVIGLAAVTTGLLGLWEVLR